jgi:hypothetical protein
MIADVVRQRIRDRIERGTLPHDRTIELWQTPGFGQTCDGCGLPITTTDWMYLMCADDWRAIHLHEDCLVFWEEERNSQIPSST